MTRSRLGQFHDDVNMPASFSLLEQALWDGSSWRRTFEAVQL